VIGYLSVAHSNAYAVNGEHSLATEFLQRAESDINSGNFKGALEVLAIVVEDYEESPRLFTLTGRAFEGLGSSEMAIKSYSKAIYLDPEYNEASLLMARLWERTGKLQEALLEYENLYRADYLSVEAVLAIGMVKMKLEDFDGAIGGYEEYLRIRGEDWKILFDRSRFTPARTSMPFTAAPFCARNWDPKRKQLLISTPSSRTRRNSPMPIFTADE